MTLLNANSNMDRRGLILGASVAVAGSAIVAAPDALAATDALPLTTIVPIRADTTLSAPVAISVGGGFDISAGATLTCTGDIGALAAQIFFGEGRVDLTRSRVLAARPEWWGAVPDRAELDNVAAIEAALAAHVAVQLSAGDYYLSRTLQLTQNNRRLWGVGRTRDSRGTRLLLRNADGAVVRVGTVSDPGGVNNYARGIDVRNLILGRSVTPDFNAPPNRSSIGLAILHVLDSVFMDVRSEGHATGYAISGAVRSYLHDCTAYLSIDGAATGQPQFTGFDLFGQIAGLSGANASLYLIDCNAVAGSGAFKQTLGIRTSGAIADTFIVRFETSGITDGIVIDGRVSTLTAVQQRFAHLNVSIQTPVLDQCRRGIAIANLSDFAAISIDNPYVAVAPDGSAAIEVVASGGTVSINGGMVHGGAAGASGAATGIALTDSGGSLVSGTKILNFAKAVTATRLRGFDIAVAINGRGVRSDIGAITITDSRHGLVRPLITGDADSFAAGVAIDSASRTVAIELSGVDPACVRGAEVARAGKRVVPQAGRVVVA